VISYFRDRPPGSPPTTHGLAHNIGALVNFVFILIAALFLGAAFGEDYHRRRVRGRCIILSVST
jgi:hypothetical protein